MACPYFVPERRVETNVWARPPRMPLGAIFVGRCEAGPGAVTEPPEERQRELCNQGYARGECACFPGDAAADAVRFSVAGEEDGRVSLIWVREREHAPVEFGRIECCGGRVEGAEGRLAAQARAFVESFERR